MSTVTIITPDDLLTMPDGDAYELVDGQLVERNSSADASFVAGNVLSLLQGHCNAHRLGWVYPGGAGYKCFENDPRRVRRADASYFALNSLTRSQARGRGHFAVAPDLLVEVVSPTDAFEDVELKVAEWLDAGAKLVWVVQPTAKKVRVFRPGQSEKILLAGDELSGEDVVAGFRCQVTEFFRDPTDDMTPKHERNGE
jgi:Uma2 family endonuclease